MLFPHPTRRAALGLILAAPLVHAQQGETAEQRLEAVVVTGNALRSLDTATPVSVLQGDELVRQRGSTLAETLRGQGGVAATWFGPNANRPVIRGLDGDRIRMLSNSGASLDASSLSFDHAVPIDPLVVERIEVLRGPAALQYGGSAIGGAVNAIDNRIPRQAQVGLAGAGELRLGGAADERGGSALLEGGNGAFGWHADAFGRDTSDLRVPRFTPIEDGTALPETERVRNSASRTRGGALGGAATFATGYVGLAVDRYESRYGIVVEPDVTVDMLRDHVALAGEWRELAGPIRTLRAQLGHTRYRHAEVEGSGAIGTTFRTEGVEGRIEAEHAPIGALRGVVGVQLEDFDFSALGEEAFVPNTRTQRQAVFAVEEWPWALGKFGLGARFERVRIGSDGDADPAAPQFGPASERRFTPKSVSVSQTVPVAGGGSFTGTLSRSERAPTSFELFASGVHAATGAYERGDAALAVERGTQVDLSARWGEGPDRLRLSAFAARYRGFIALQATGQRVDIVDDLGNVESFPEYAFIAVPARLHGYEVEAGRRLVASPWTLDLSGGLDATRATRRDTGEPLPRIAPLRARLRLAAGLDGWSGRVELVHAAAQHRVGPDDVATGGYRLINLALSRRWTIGASDLHAFAAIDNLGDRLAHSATSIRTVRELSPLPGRELKVGLRVTF